MGSVGSHVSDQKFNLYSPYSRIYGKDLRICVDRFVTKYDAHFSMDELQEKGTLFQNFPFCLEAIDVTFQQANRPSGNMQEGKVYFSGKHKLYGYKVEVAVRPNGIASDFSKHYPGSVSDVSILYDRIKSHQCRLEKRDEEEKIEDNFPMSERFGDSWGLLMDKGYQGAADQIRAIIPKKKPIRGVLSRADEDYNKRLYSDRILVENYFGRLGQLWTVCSSKYVWSEKLYDTIFGLSIAFTNFHITIHSLRDNDKD